MALKDIIENNRLRKLELILLESHPSSEDITDILNTLPPTKTLKKLKLKLSDQPSYMDILTLMAEATLRESAPREFAGFVTTPYLVKSTINTFMAKHAKDWANNYGKHTDCELGTEVCGNFSLVVKAAPKPPTEEEVQHNFKILEYALLDKSSNKKGAKSYRDYLYDRTQQILNLPEIKKELILAGPKIPGKIYPEHTMSYLTEAITNFMRERTASGIDYKKEFAQMSKREKEEVLGQITEDIFDYIKQDIPRQLGTEAKYVYRARYNEISISFGTQTGKPR